MARAFSGTAQNWQKKNGPIAGPFSLPRNSVTAIAMLDDHHPVVMVPVAFVPAAVAMFAHFGTRAVVVMIAAAFDHDGFRACNRRPRNGDRAKGCNDVSKLLHNVLLG